MIDLIVLLFLLIYFLHNKLEPFISTSPLPYHNESLSGKSISSYQYSDNQSSDNQSSENQSCKNKLSENQYHFISDQHICNQLKKKKKNHTRKSSNSDPLNHILYSREMGTINSFNIQPIGIDRNINLEDNLLLKKNINITHFNKFPTYNTARLKHHLGVSLPFKNINLGGKKFTTNSCIINGKNVCNNKSIGDVIGAIPLKKLNIKYLNKMNIGPINHNISGFIYKNIRLYLYLINYINKYILFHLGNNDIQSNFTNDETILEIAFENDIHNFKCIYLCTFNVSNHHKSYKLLIEFEFNKKSVESASIPNQFLDMKSKVKGKIYINTIKILETSHVDSIIKGYDTKKEYIHLNKDRYNHIKYPYQGYKDYVRNSDEHTYHLSKQQKNKLLEDILKKKIENIKECFYSRKNCQNTNIPFSLISWIPNVKIE